MGLDMYLYATKYMSKSWGKKKEQEQSKKLRKQFGMSDSGNANSVTLKFEIGYWRKANQIHNWFVTNCGEGKDDCNPYRVDREDLKKLLALIEKVLSIKSVEIARELLPVKSGFFFGETEYNLDYYEDLQYSKQLIELALGLSDDFEFEYCASW